MGSYKINKGLDLPLSGRPEAEIRDSAWTDKAAVYPSEFLEVKPKLQVEVGDKVKRGSLLFSCKKRTDLQFLSPIAGTVKEINLGERRSIREIVLETDQSNETVAFDKYSREEIRQLPRGTAMEMLLKTGFLAFIRQRPFSRIASSTLEPKAIFVNAMHTAPFQADPGLVTQADKPAFQAGLDLMTRLTNGKVYLSIASEASCPALTEAANVEINSFSGPHPAGNSSIHISRLDPIKPHDVVWTVDACDLVLIGQLFLNGELPATQIISLGGPGVKPENRVHYRTYRGAWLKEMLEPKLAAGEQRIINGDILTGDQISPASGLRFFGTGITVIPEKRERQFLGWLEPGLDTFSTSKLFLSRWLKKRRVWDLNTADHGGKRAMFATGIYDRVMPMNIMVDFLVRAVIGHETEDAVKLGILETDPEDFALCSYLCPSRTDIAGIIRQGLEEIEEEGIYSQEQE